MKSRYLNPNPLSGSLRRRMQLHLPQHFILLCHILEVPMEKVLEDFMNTVSQDYHALQFAKNDLAEYVIVCGYGKEKFTEEQRQQLLRELQNISALWPDDAPIPFLRKHAAWRDEYYRYLLEKWKPR